MATEKQRLTFISYSRADSEFALELAKELRSAGFYIWLDQLDIPTGARWDDEVEKALLECAIFMVILTPESIASNNVKDEIGYAIDSNKRILPVLLENAVLPFRLRRFQYVDFTKKSSNDGIEAAKQLLRKLLNEPTAPVVLTPPPTREEKATPPGNSESRPPSTESVEEQKARVIQLARERERIERERRAQAASPKPVPHPKAPETHTRAKPLVKNIPVVAGAGLFSIACLIAGWMLMRSIILPADVPPTDPPITLVSTFTPTVTPTLASTDTPTSAITITPIDTLTPTASATPTDTTTPTVTPLSPSDPVQFVYFYFEKLIYNKSDENYAIAWSLLTETFKAKNNASGFGDYKQTWEKVVEWKRPTLTARSINTSIVLVSASEIWFRSTAWYKLPLPGKDPPQYCLVRDDSRNTWMIESRSKCDQ